MNNTYKGLKYLTIWILLYFVTKYTCGYKLKNCDIVLMTTVLTLILCIIDNVFSLSSLNNELSNIEYEYMTNLTEQNTQTTTLNNNNVTTTTLNNNNVVTATSHTQSNDLFSSGETKNGFVYDSAQSNNEKWHEQKLEPRKFSGAENINQIGTANGQSRDNMLVNHMQYSDFNRMPPSFYKNDFEYGYSFMPPKDWYPVPPYPPVCSSNATCITQPVYVDNSTMNLKEWHQTQKFTPPDTINTRYLAEVTNSNN